MESFSRYFFGSRTIPAVLVVTAAPAWLYSIRNSTDWRGWFMAVLCTAALVLWTAARSFSRR